MYFIKHSWNFNLSCAVLCLVAQLWPTLWDPMDCSQPSSSVHGVLQAIMLEWVAMPSSRESSQPRDWTEVSCIAGGVVTIWATRESPRILEWVALPFSRGIFPTQGLNQGLLHCRWILYQLTCPEAPLSPYQVPTSRRRRKETTQGNKYHEVKLMSEASWNNIHVSFSIPIAFYCYICFVSTYPIM